MKTISRYIMTLALLITAVGGAWAQTQWTSGDCTVTLNNGTLTVSGKGAMADYTQSDKRPWDGNRNDITSVVVESGVTSVGKNTFESFTNLTSVTLPEGLTAIGPYAFCNCSSLQSITIPSTVTSIGEGAFDSCSAMTSVTLPEGLTAIGAGTFGSCSSLTSITIPSTVTSIGDMAFKSCSSLTSITIPSTVTSIGNYAFMKSSAISDVNLYANPDNLTWGNTKMSFKENKATQCHVLAEHLSAYQNNFSSVNVTFVGDLQPLATPIEVTTNKAEGETIFTEASFEMPGNDVTVNYELVRDMSVQMQAQVGDDPAKQPRFRVQWNGKGWVPADLDYKQVMALFSVNDLIEKTTLAPENYSVNIYAIDAEGNPTGNAMDFQTFTFAPGRYCVTASANALLGAPYEGTTAPSNIFELIQGYQIVIPAGEYATFYHNEKLRIEDTDAELYTIASVSTTEAVLSEKMTVAPSETPLLVYNAGSETKTFLLIPTDDEASEVLVAAEFRGTLAAKDMPASSSTMDYYVCTGKAFTWVRDAGQIAANRCWLQIGSGNQPANTRASSRAITRGFGGIDGTTGIDAIDNEQFANDTYYDLQGRKVQNPKRGGIYIHNGKKVIKH